MGTAEGGGAPDQGCAPGPTGVMTPPALIGEGGEELASAEGAIERRGERVAAGPRAALQGPISCSGGVVGSRVAGVLM